MTLRSKHSGNQLQSEIAHLMKDNFMRLIKEGVVHSERGEKTLTFVFNNYLYLIALGLSCSMWDLVPWPGIEPNTQALGAQSLSHWTTKESESERVKVTQSCLTLFHPMDYIQSGILQARILEWVAFPFSRGSSQPRNRTQVSHTADGFFTNRAQGKSLFNFLTQ